MNASEICAIVKDLPRDAWPAGVEHLPKRGTFFHHAPPNAGGNDLHPGLAELAFIGSMTVWLATKGHVGIKNFGMVRVTAIVEGRDVDIHYGQIGASPLAALASAVKAVAGKEGA